jgi:hypothetical protein
MRVKFLLTAVILFVFSATVAMAAAPRARKSVSDRTVANLANGEAGDSVKDLPKVARNQKRPMPRALCDDCDPLNPDPDGGGYTSGGCNCSRICYEGHSGCNLSVANNGCTAGTYPEMCKSCSVSGGCGW